MQCIAIMLLLSVSVPVLASELWFQMTCYVCTLRVTVHVMCHSLQSSSMVGTSYLLTNITIASYFVELSTQRYKTRQTNTGHEEVGIPTSILVPTAVMSHYLQRAIGMALGTQVHLSCDLPVHVIHSACVPSPNNFLHTFLLASIAKKYMLHALGVQFSQCQ